MSIEDDETELTRPFSSEELRDYEEYKVRASAAKLWRNVSREEKVARFGDFSSHIVVTTLFPFLPIVLSFIRDFQVDPQDYVLGVSFFTLTVGITSRSKGMLLFGVICSVVSLVTYGELLANPNNTPNLSLRIWISTVFGAIVAILNLYVSAKKILGEGEPGVMGE